MHVVSSLLAALTKRHMFPVICDLMLQVVFSSAVDGCLRPNKTTSVSIHAPTPSFLDRSPLWNDHQLPAKRPREDTYNPPCVTNIFDAICKRHRFTIASARNYRSSTSIFESPVSKPPISNCVEYIQECILLLVHLFARCLRASTCKICPQKSTSHSFPPLFPQELPTCCRTFAQRLFAWLQPHIEVPRVEQYVNVIREVLTYDVKVYWFSCREITVVSWICFGTHSKAEEHFSEG